MIFFLYRILVSILNIHEFSNTECTFCVPVTSIRISDVRKRMYEFKIVCIRSGDGKAALEKSICINSCFTRVSFDCAFYNYSILILF